MDRGRKWRDSEAKKHLLQDLDLGIITDEMDAREVYMLREEYQEFEFEKFRDRLRDYKKKKAEKTTRSFAEEQARQEDVQDHPPPSHNHRGVPRWEGSEAQKLLKVDVESGASRSMKPVELWQSNPVYQAFDKDVFRGHIYQERRRQKFLKWLENKDG
jgi:hypothetical protein